MVEHTKGDWSIRDTMVICNGQVIALCGHERALPANEKRANTMLIAAAPIGYTLAEMILGGQDYHLCLAKAREFMAKANGGT